MKIKTKSVLLAALLTVLANTQVYAAQDEYLTHMLAGQEASKTGNYAEAAKLYQAAVDDRASQPKSYEMMVAKECLGRQLKRLRKFKEAEEMFVQATDGYAACKGPKSLDVALSAGFLGSIYMFEGKAADAIVAYDRAIAAGQDKQEAQTELAHWYCFRGTCLGALKRSGAEESFKRSMELVEKLPPDELLAADISDYAAYLERNGDKAAAEKMNAKAKAILAKIKK